MIFVVLKFYRNLKLGLLLATKQELVDRIKMNKHWRKYFKLLRVVMNMKYAYL